MGEIYMTVKGLNSKSTRLEEINEGGRKRRRNSHPKKHCSRTVLFLCTVRIKTRALFGYMYEYSLNAHAHTHTLITNSRFMSAILRHLVCSLSFFFFSWLP